MNLPPLDKEVLANMPFYPTLMPDFGIKFGGVKPEPPKDLSSEECISLFGAKEAVCMNFIPQMLTALALDQVEQFVKFCRENRLSEYKKHNRQMRQCVEEYNHELRKSYGKSWYAYQNYLNRLRKAVEVDLFKCWCTFFNEAARQYVGDSSCEVPARVTFIRMLLTFVEDFDKNVDKVIAERINKPCCRKQDPYCFLISVLCMDIAESHGYKMEINNNMIVCIKVLANRCRAIVDAIMAEEDALEESKR